MLVAELSGDAAWTDSFGKRAKDWLEKHL